MSTTVSEPQATTPDVSADTAAATTATASAQPTTAATPPTATPPVVDEWQTALETWADDLQAACQPYLDSKLREPSSILWRSIYGSLTCICAEPTEALKKPSWRMVAAANKLAVAAASPFCTADGHFRGTDPGNVHVFDLTRPALDWIDAVRDRRNGPPVTITTVHKLPTVEELEKSGCSWDAVCLALGLRTLMGRMPTSDEWFDIKRGEHPTVKVPTTRTTTCQSKPWPDLPQRLHTTAWAIVVLSKVLNVKPPKVEDLL